MKNTYKLLLVTFCLLSSQTVFGQLAYWVNNTGASRPATVTVNAVVYNTAPTTYTSIQSALDQVYYNSNGGVIYITDGRYVNPSSLTTPNTNCNLNASQDANLSLNLNVYYPGSSVIVTSETGDFRTSSARLVGYGIQVLDDNADITIQGLELDSVHVNGLYFPAPAGNYGTTTIKNNQITNTRGHGIKSDSPADWGAWIIEGNCFQNIGYFDARGNCTTPAPVSAMWLGEPSQLTVINNIIKRVRWAGILLDGYSFQNGYVGGTETTVISGNYVSDTQDAGIQIGFSTGRFFHPSGVSINNNILKSCNMSLDAGRGAIVLLSSNVEGVSIQNNDISLSHNGIAICVAGWDNSSSTKAINYNNVYDLMGGYGVTHIANIAPNGLYGTGDNLSFYNFENNYWGAVDGPLNAGGAGEELMKDAVNTAYSLGSFDYTPFATTANTVTNSTCATCLTIDWYEDTDNDGYGDVSSTTSTSCAWPAGYVCNPDDCDDTDAAIGPTMTVTITGVSPAGESVGDNVTITGTGFLASSTVEIGGTSMSVVSINATTIVATLPVGCSGDIVVTSCNSQSSGSAYSYATPAIVAVSPLAGTPASSLTIDGTNFSPTGNSVTIGGISATVTSESATEIVVTLPAGICGGDVVVTDACSVQTSAVSYTYAASNIASVSPSLGSGGDVVTISGIGFLSSGNTVTIGATAMSVQSESATSITALLPVDLCNGNIVVTNCGTASNAVGYTYATPSIASVSPTNGVVGGSLTIEGEDFQTTGCTVTVGGVNATIQSATATEIVITLPDGTCGGDVVVTNSCAAASNAVNYDYNSFQWKGAVSGEWTDDANWCGGSAPTASDDVFVSDGVNAPHITSAPGSPALCDNLTVASGATLIIDAGKAMTIEGDVVNNGTILVKADATGIGSLITKGTVSGAGACKMEQYLTGSGGATPDGLFYYVSSPVTSTYIYDYNVDAGDKLWTADEVTQSYVPQTVGAVSMVPMVGYIARMGSTQTITFNEVNLNVQYNTGPQTTGATLTRTGTTEQNRGYNLVGNPYPSSVNWTLASRTNLETTMWYRTHQGSTMLYDTYNAAGGVGTNNNGNGAVTNTIPPTQAFWVRVPIDGQTGTLGFDNSLRSHGTQAGIYKTSASEGTVRMVLGNGTNTDEAILLFNSDADDLYDQFDSQKFWAGLNIPQIYTTIGSDSLVINGMNSIAANPVVDLGVKLPVVGNYTLNASEITVIGETVHLEDRLLGYFQDLNVEPNYSFTSTVAGNIPTRFALHFGMSAVGIENGSVTNSQVYTSNNQLNIILSGSLENGKAEMLDMAGRTVETFNLNSTRTTTEMNVNTGVYLVRVETGKGIDTHRILID